MAHADAPEVSVTTDELTLVKRLDREQFSNMGVIFDIHSRSDRPVVIRVTDPIPPSTPVGFHPRHGGRDWMLDVDSVVFERQLSPDEQLSTLYTIGADDFDAEAFRREPRVAVRALDADEFRVVNLPEGFTSARSPENGGANPVSEQALKHPDGLSALLDSLDAEREPTGTTIPHPGSQPSDSKGVEPVDRIDGDELRRTLEGIEGAIVRLFDAVDPIELVEESKIPSRSRATVAHMNAIHYHLERIERLLDVSVIGSEPKDSREDSSPSFVSPPPTTSEPGVLASPRPSQGLPLFWLVALLGAWTALAGFLQPPGMARAGVLYGLGGVVFVSGAIGWLYPEEKLPLPLLPAIVLLSGLGIMLQAFLFGDPTALLGISTIGAGALITIIPIVVENRRWQLLGLMER